MRSVLCAGKGLCRQQLAQRAIRTLCQPIRSSGVQTTLNHRQAGMLWQQVRYARKARGAPVESVPEMDEMPEDLPEVPAEILADWEKDPNVQEALEFFASEELKGKKVLSYRDAAQMLELIGCDRATFMSIFDPEDDDLDDGKGKGNGKGMDWEDGSMISGKSGKGKGGMKGSFQDDFDDFGGKGKGGQKGGFLDDFDDVGGGKSYGGKGKKGKKGGFDDFDDFGGGKSKGKGKRGGKGGY